MQNWQSEFTQHLTLLQLRVAEILKLESLDALLIHSGQLKKTFLDDLHYPFQVNPHFKHFMPLVALPNSWILLNGVNKPKLVLYQPENIWQATPKLAIEEWQQWFEVDMLTRAELVGDVLPYDRANMAYIGENIEVADALGIGHKNPEPVLHYLHYHRAYKTAFELSCIRQANKKAIAGHLAAKQSFSQGQSEFEIQQAFCRATGQTESDLPYPNIVAVNEHGAILHYDQQNRTAVPCHSMLIDAGAQHFGYAADISRTYSTESSRFSELIDAMGVLQQGLVAQVRPGLKFVDLHNEMHLRIASLLLEYQLVAGSLESVIEQGITQTFMPHGLGHLLGLQVHDVGGFMQDDRGTNLTPPETSPYLRCTRVLELNQVLTIEPGLYFMPQLLSQLKQQAGGKQVHWSLVEALLPYGGIRIEDNIIVHAAKAENVTRELGLS
ncbi:Xaa-Pro dipeptidase [Motilimonas pumila]|uniref:Xaa-Pro dipeptidase n=1 Tax=Motilimonas pumila TaxID=2303987 RepID=A0A418YE44_9GAMM|nr:Xaa-Pro dipeptidase [Motilimonas pumila]RJG42802.1 Xaa-Pro dipeptidase [Motilimonas pumila]